MTKEQIGVVRERYDATVKWLPFLLGDANGLQGFRETIETIPALLEALEGAEDDNERLCVALKLAQARAEALERAIRSVAPRMTPCDLCANWSDDGCVRPESCSIWTPHGKDNWQFDQARFERSGNDD